MSETTTMNERKSVSIIILSSYWIWIAGGMHLTSITNA